VDWCLSRMAKHGRRLVSQEAFNPKGSAPLWRGFSFFGDSARPEDYLAAADHPGESEQTPTA
jgi:hypothetical protein